MVRFGIEARESDGGALRGLQFRSGLSHLHAFGWWNPHVKAAVGGLPGEDLAGSVQQTVEPVSIQCLEGVCLGRWEKSWSGDRALVAQRASTGMDIMQIGR